MNWELLIAVCALLISLISAIISPLITAHYRDKSEKRQMLAQDVKEYVEVLQMHLSGDYKNQAELLGVTTLLQAHFSKADDRLLFQKLNKAALIIYDHEDPKSVVEAAAEARQALEKLIDLVYKKMC